MTDWVRAYLATALAALSTVSCSVGHRSSAAPGLKAADELHARVANMIASGQIRFTGGDGASTGPVVIEGTEDEFAGIAAEYQYIQSKHRRPRVDWIPVSQAFDCDAAKCFDIIDIVLAATGEQRSYRFDISAFRPPAPERRTVDVTVSSDDGGLADLRQ